MLATMKSNWNSSYIDGGNAKWSAKKLRQFLIKPNMQLPHDPATAAWALIPEK